MLRELSVLDAVELKRHRVDLAAGRLKAHEIAFVRPTDRVQNTHLVALGNDRGNRQLEIGKGRVKAAEILFESFAPRALPGQMIVVILCHDLVKDLEIGTFDSGEEPPDEFFVLFYIRRHAATSFFLKSTWSAIPVPDTYRSSNLNEFLAGDTAAEL